jgi:SAM-dependent methyltransferase
LTSRFIAPLLDAAGVCAGTRVLDVACGPGLVAEAARERGATIVALDFTPEMIAIARSRCPDIEFRRGDALALPFADGAFDVVVMNFGLLHLPRAERALSEAARVLRPGGAYAFTVWAEPEESAGARLVLDAVAAQGDLRVDVPQGPDHLRHGRADEWRRTLRDAGFDADSVTVTLVRAEWDVPTDFFLFEAERHAGVRTAALLAAQTPAALAEIERSITCAVRAFKTDDGFAIPYAAYVVSARRRDDA